MHVFILIAVYFVRSQCDKASQVDYRLFSQYFVGFTGSILYFCRFNKEVQQKLLTTLWLNIIAWIQQCTLLSKEHPTCTLMDRFLSLSLLCAEYSIGLPKCI